MNKKNDVIQEVLLHFDTVLIGRANFCSTVRGKPGGQRSSSYSRLGRIIYTIKDGEVRVVEVLKITPDHKY
jgi:hypothetical protein